MGLLSLGLGSEALTVFILFSLLCSANYIINDLIDIDHDRGHPQKKHHPLASGNLAISEAALPICSFLRA